MLECESMCYNCAKWLIRYLCKNWQNAQLFIALTGIHFQILNIEIQFDKSVWHINYRLSHFVNNFRCRLNGIDRGFSSSTHFNERNVQCSCIHHYFVCDARATYKSNRRNRQSSAHSSTWIPFSSSAFRYTATFTYQIIHESRICSYVCELVPFQNHKLIECKFMSLLIFVFRFVFFFCR